MIVFDRLFGTFAEAPQGERLRYGLAGGTPTLNPVRIALGEWCAVIRDIRNASSARERLRILVAPPGSTAWGHSGRSSGARQQSLHGRGISTADRVAAPRDGHPPPCAVRRQ
jgi:hypothetical protein